MKIKGVHIMDVLPNSIANELGIVAGDQLLTINGAAINDILEYRFLTTDEFLEVEILKQNGECWIYEVEKEYDENIGIVFDGIIDEPKSCHNKCIFCFIDQLPKGMRETLYFKDDDTRLSFLQGNFVTLTNLKESELRKIIKFHISPINVSVHTTNSDLRIKMLNNKNAGKIMDYLSELKEGGIQVKAQIVLCPGVNDKENLTQTLKDLTAFYPELSCVAVVPVGLTKHREGLSALREFDKISAGEVIKQIEALQQEFLRELDTRFVFLSDEFYLLAQEKLPSYETYEGFSQLENGVGLITLLEEEIEGAIEDVAGDFQAKEVRATIATGEYAAPFIQSAIEKIKNKLGHFDIQIRTISNDFFGHSVKVAGLITGQDIIHQLEGQDIGSTLFLVESMLRDGEEVFLDDVTMADIEKKLHVNIVICKEDGSDLVNHIINLQKNN